MVVEQDHISEVESHGGDGKKNKVKKGKAKKTVKLKKVKAEKLNKNKEDKSTFTAHFETAEQLLKAFVNLDGKATTIRKVQLLHSRFQKAIIEKKVSSKVINL